MEAYLKELGKKFRIELLGSESRLLETFYPIPKGVLSEMLKSEFLKHLFKNILPLVKSFKGRGGFKSFEDLISNVFYNGFVSSLEIQVFREKNYYDLDWPGFNRLHDQCLLNNFSFLISEINKILNDDSNNQSVREDELLILLGLNWENLIRWYSSGFNLNAKLFDLISERVKEFKIDDPGKKKKVEEAVSNLGLKFLLAHLEIPFENFKNINCKDEDVCYGLICEIIRLLIKDEKIGVEFPARPVLKELSSVSSLPQEPEFTEKEPEIGDFLTVEAPVFEPRDYVSMFKKYPDFSKLKLLSNMMKVHLLRNHLNERFNDVLGLAESAWRSDDGTTEKFSELNIIKEKIENISVLFRKTRVKSIVDNFAKELGVEEIEGFDSFLNGLLEMLKLNAFILSKGRVLFKEGANEQQKSEGRLLLYMAGQLKEKIETIAVGIESFLASRKFQGGEISRENIAFLSKFFDEKSFSDISLLLKEIDESISIFREVNGIVGVRGELQRFDDKLRESISEETAEKLDDF